jgi:uncharacterized membrane protein YoaK (UPF0700 family)
MTRLHHRSLYTIGLLLLTASTGVIDAVSYLALDRVFTGNMTGNLLFIGFALTGVDDIPLLNNALALVGFMVGAALGARSLKHLKAGSFARTSGFILALGSVITLIVSISWWQVDSLNSSGQITITTILAMLMGAQVAAVKPIGNSDITTVVVTSTIANLARESRLAGGKQAFHVWRDRLGAIVAMGLGATFGAALVTASGGPAALILAICVMSAATWLLIIGSRNHRIYLASETD